MKHQRKETPIDDVMGVSQPLTFSLSVRDISNCVMNVMLHIKLLADTILS